MPREGISLCTTSILIDLGRHLSATCLQQDCDTPKPREGSCGRRTVCRLVLALGLRMPKPTLEAEAEAAFETVFRLDTMGGLSPNLVFRQCVREGWLLFW